MSDDKAREACAAEQWPLSDNWWLHFANEPHPRHEGFDNIIVTAETGDYKREITSIMVEKIDGLVCESHSFIGALIHQNVQRLEAKVKELEDDLAGEQDDCFQRGMNNIKLTKERDQYKAECEKLVEALEKTLNESAHFDLDLEGWQVNEILEPALAAHNKFKESLK